MRLRAVSISAAGLVWATGLVWAVELHPPSAARLAKVRRIYVDQLGGGPGSDQMRDMLFAAIQNSGLFVLTENPEKADAVMKGSSDLQSFFEEHQANESIGLHAAEASGSSAGASLGTNSSSHASLSTGITQSESSRSKERRQEAGASVRLVDSEGDVVWSTTQESNGAKFRSALADVADKIARRLTEETKKARASVAMAPAAPAGSAVTGP